jgi:hypothetical protein
MNENSAHKYFTNRAAVAGFNTVVEKMFKRCANYQKVHFDEIKSFYIESIGDHSTGHGDCDANFIVFIECLYVSFFLVSHHLRNEKLFT